MLFALAYAGSASVQKGLGFLLFFWFAHGLSVEDYARFGLLYALQTAVAALAVAGIVETTIGGLKSARSTVQQQRLLNSANLVHLGSAFFSFAVVVAAFSWSKSFGWAALFVAAAGGVLTSFFTIQSQLARIVENHRVALTLGFVPQIVGLAGGLAGFLIERSSLGFFAGFASGLVLSLPLVRLTSFGFARSHTERSDIKYMLLHMGPYILVAVVDWFGGYGNTYLVKIFFSSEVVARFVFAYTLSSIMHLIATSMNQAWSPRVFKMVHDYSTEIAERENRKFYLLEGMVLGVASGAILFILPVIMNLIGPSMLPYSGIQLEVSILFAAYVCVVPWYHSQNYYYVHAKGALLMRISIVSSLIGLVLWIVAAWLLGALGAYVGFFLMMVVKMVCGVFWARRQWGIRVLWHGPVLGLLPLLLGVWASQWAAG